MKQTYIQIYINTSINRDLTIDNLTLHLTKKKISWQLTSVLYVAVDGDQRQITVGGGSRWLGHQGGIDDLEGTIADPDEANADGGIDIFKDLPSTSQDFNKTEFGIEQEIWFFFIL